jgi:hypothetical protein
MNELIIDCIMCDGKIGRDKGRWEFMRDGEGIKGRQVMSDGRIKEGSLVI